MKLKVLKAFTWAHRGVQVEEFAPDQEIETEDPDLIEVATREGWVEGAVPLLNQDGLQLDGPTIAEFVAAGYPAANYPPAGYASRSTSDEVAAAIAAAAPVTESHAKDEEAMPEQTDIAPSPKAAKKAPEKAASTKAPETK